MQVTKLRASNAQGLVPAGAYFANLSSKLRDANAREHNVRTQLDDEDRELEARYRGSSPSRTNVFAPQAAYRSSSMRSGSSRPSFTRTRNVTASLPSTMR